MGNLINKIETLKNEKDAVLLVHNYQIEDIQKIADHLGDSLQLSQVAAKTENRIIVFAGVKFMAETAKILSPDKKVLLPRLDAGCPMADMITVKELRELKAEHPRAKVVTYVNSSVEIKAESDVCCTSSNAIQVVKNIKEEEVIFIPDKNLGAYVQSKVPAKKIILFEGYCYVHNRIQKWELLKTREKYPRAKILVHPEVRGELIEIADEVLSTGGMIKYGARSPHNQFIVATEQGLLDRLTRENPGKHFYPAVKPKICSNMKRTALQDIYISLAEEKYEIKIDKTISAKAKHALNQMINYI